MVDAAQLNQRILAACPGFSGVYSLAVGDGILCQGAIGEQRTPGGAAIRDDTRFAMASGAKAFTALAVLKLSEQQLISPDDSVAGLLPGRFPRMDERVTVRHLLTHTSGFGDYFDESIEDKRYEDLWQAIPPATMTSPDAFLPLLRDLPMEFAPGARFKYNNGAYVILSMIVEKISGTSFPAFVKNTVLEPCGMSGSGYFRLDSLPPNTATGYLQDKRGELKANTLAMPVIGGGDGGAFTTAGDMLRFWRGLREGKAVSPEVLAGAWSPRVFRGEGDIWYGYGFWMEKRNGEVRKIYIMGGDPGVSFRSAFYPAGDAVITVMCNRDSGSLLATKILETALEAG